MNKEERALYMKEYRKTPQWKLSKQTSDKKYYLKNKEQVKEKNKKWKENNLEKFYLKNKEWAQNNPDRVKAIQKQYRNNNPHYKIRNLFHNLKKRNLDSLPIEFNLIKNHIESLFTLDMNWSNIEIDHKVPISWFKSNTPSDLINNLENLQPMLILENRKKSASFSSPISSDYFNKISPYITEERIKQLKFQLGL